MKSLAGLKFKINKLRKILLALEFSGNHNLETELNALKQLSQHQQQINTDLLSKIDSITLGFPEMEYHFLRLSDISKLLLLERNFSWKVQADRPIATDSLDHIVPRGVRADETRSPGFVKAVKTLFNGPISYLDLGCAGGGLVYDFIMEDCQAIGIEGSDYAIVHNRAYWREIPWALFTADLTGSVQVFDITGPAKFDVIGAWEFFEHISESDISKVLENVKRHLRDGNSLLLANIATFDDHDGDIHWHQSVQNKEWWEKKFNESGFELVEYPFSQDLNPRGSGNNLGTWKGDYDIKLNPHLGFYVAARCVDL